MAELYSQFDTLSIEQKANHLIGKTFNEIKYMNSSDGNKLELRSSAPEYLPLNSKRNDVSDLYEIIEKYFRINNEINQSESNNDFLLKIIPYEKKEKDFYVLTNLTLCKIPNIEYDLDFNNSEIFKKSKIILLIFYNCPNHKYNDLDSKINFVHFFTPSKIDQILIQKDYEYIISKIKNEKIDELSESDTMYLSARRSHCFSCTAFSDKEKRPTNEQIESFFYYKKSYLSFILNQNIQRIQNSDTLIENDNTFLETSNFEEYIYSLVNKYIGKTDKELCEVFNIKYNNGKAQWISLVHKILGIKSGNATEFVKSNIIIKAIRIEENGSIIQSSSLPPIKFKELANEIWEESILFNYFEQTKFLFVVFKKEKDCYILKGCQLWNMSYDDLNTEVYDGWYKIKEIIKNGVKFKIKTNKNGDVIVKNNLPSKSDNRVIHMRPHAGHAYYKLKDGFTEGKSSDGDLLPDGQYMTKQSFWLNNSYIMSILKDELKD